MAPLETRHTSPFERYLPGQVLTLNAAESSDTLTVRISRLQTPHTLSCSMVVDILDGWGKDDSVPTTAFLKLFDRRFAESFRRDNYIKPWSKDLEKEYISAPKSDMVKFLHQLHNNPKALMNTERAWDGAKNEAFLADEMRRMHATETRVYKTLSASQGKQIPRLYASVDVTMAVEGGTPWHRQEELFSIGGILIEYIPGFTLRDMPAVAPRSSWQDIMDEALEAVDILGDHDILNRDVHPGNFMVLPLPERHQHPRGYRVCMIDFGLCQFRGPHESDVEWGRRKFEQDEEGAVGLVMKEMLAEQHGFDLRYRDSGRYCEFAGAGKAERLTDEDRIRMRRSGGVDVVSIPRTCSHYGWIGD